MTRSSKTRSDGKTVKVNGHANVFSVETFLSQNAERQLLACILVDPAVLLLSDVARVRHTHYLDPDLQQVAYAIDRLRDEGRPVVDTRVVEIFRANCVTDHRRLFFEISSSIGTTADVRTYAEMVLDAAARRRQSQLAEEIQRQVLANLPPRDIDGLLEQYLANRQLRDTSDAFQLLTCDQVAEWPDEEYLADGLIVKGQPGVIGAPYKGMKTSVCTDICISLPTGGMCLGFFRVRRPVKTLFMSAESGLSTLKKTAASVCHSAGLDWPQRVNGEIVGDELLRANLRWCTTLPKIGIDDDLRRLDHAYLEFPFEVLVIDPLFKAISGDGAENLMIQGAKLMHLQKWCEERTVTLIVVHHVSKPASRLYDPAKLGDLTYAGIAEHVRWWLLMSRREEYLPPNPVHKLWFSAGGSAGHAGLWALDIDQGEFEEGRPRLWNVTLQQGDEARRSDQDQKTSARETAKQAKIRENLQTILTVLLKFPEGETQTAIRNNTALNSSQVAAAIREGIDERQIVPCEVRKSGQRTPREGFRLNTQDTHRENRENNHQENTFPLTGSTGKGKGGL
ncbi:AAA family ATPase [Anatilimnocola floriformis]|uniref:AAA family ATPase n=1 Tax=Anatilimnocola floriformis TaxID=2948575 RepID=UPI0020C4F4D6|nr:AAA family ATPase [Anatilimnocola floriformis]